MQLPAGSPARRLAQAAIRRQRQLLRRRIFQATAHAIGAETQRPLALVVVGGLLSATILTLIVLPVLYQMFEQRYERRASRVGMPLQPPGDGVTEG